MKHLVLFLAFYILLKPAVPVIDFMVNYSYIIKELCVNRDKPEMECNGQCYLKKELAEAATQEFPISKERKIPIPSQEVFFQEFQEEAFAFPAFADKQAPLVFHRDMRTQREISAIFHPPAAIC